MLSVSLKERIGYLLYKILLNKDVPVCFLNTKFTEKNLRYAQAASAETNNAFRARTLG